MTRRKLEVRSFLEGNKVTLWWHDGKREHSEVSTLRPLFLTPWTMATYASGEEVDPRMYHGQPFEYLHLWPGEDNYGLTPSDEDYDELHVVRFADGREFLAQAEEIFDIEVIVGSKPWDFTPGACSPGTPFPNPLYGGKP